MVDISRSKTTSIFSASSQPSVEPTVPGAAKAGTLDSIQVKVVPPAADLSAQLKLDIRAHSAEVEEAHAQAIAVQKDVENKATQAEAEWKATPVYHFDDRLKLYNASVRAQIKYNKSVSLTRLEKMHADYLETLSKSDLSPEQQHAAYHKFKEALTNAKEMRGRADRFQELSVGCSSGVKKFRASRDAAAKTEAAGAERKLQQLLNEIQHPHTLSRDNVARVLQYRKNQLSHITEQDSDEAKQLREEIGMIQSFATGGGLDALSSQEAEKLNKLVSTAAAHYKTFQDESAKFISASPLTRTAAPLADAEQAFKAADAHVMAEIRRLNSQGPPQLRKELTDHLNHKRFLNLKT